MSGARKPKRGCSDGHCVYGARPGQHTNGGCQCLKDARTVPELKVLVRSVAWHWESKLQEVIAQAGGDK